MTKVQLRFTLESELDDAAMGRIADAQTTYGVDWIKVEKASLLVEYDASRLRPPEVLSALRSRGLPVTIAV